MHWHPAYSPSLNAKYCLSLMLKEWYIVLLPWATQLWPITPPAGKLMSLQQHRSFIHISLSVYAEYIGHTRLSFYRFLFRPIRIFLIMCAMSVSLTWHCVTLWLMTWCTKWTQPRDGFLHLMCSTFLGFIVLWPKSHLPAGGYPSSLYVCA